MLKFRTFWPSAAALLVLLLPAAIGADYLVYAGTYTRGPSKGIYVYRFETPSGKITPLGLAVETPNPSYLIESSNHRFLYAANEDREAGVSAFAIDAKTGKLTFLNKVSPKGSGPCHLALDKTGHWLAVANYNSGSVAVLPVQADGKLGEVAAFDQHKGSSANPQRQRGPHAHCILFTPDNRFMLVADLGLDEIVVYRFDAAKGAITPNDPPFGKVAPGAGVRHLALHPNGKVLYTINEIGSTITAFNFDPSSGALSEFQTVSTLPQGFTGSSNTAEIQVNRAGTFLYGSNRGHDSIALFSIDRAKFTLTPVDYTPVEGKTPRFFTLDPSGRFLFVANQDSNNIVMFRVDPKTGKLTPVGQPITDAAYPVCVLFVPSTGR